MLLIYAPEDGPRREFKLDLRRITSADAEAAEDATGWPWSLIGAQFLAESVRATRVILWLQLRRSDPGLALDDVQYLVSEVFVDFDDDELRNMRDALLGPDVPESQRAAMTRVLQARGIPLTPDDDPPDQPEPAEAGDEREAEGKGTGGDDAPPSGT